MTVAPVRTSAGPSAVGRVKPLAAAGFVPLAEFERVRFPIRSRIAARLGVSAAVVDRLIDDPSFLAKEDGSGVFVEAPLDPMSTSRSNDAAMEAGGQESAALPADVVAPQSFSLHSSPASNKTLYLQFRDITAGPYWTGQEAQIKPNFNFEDPASTFSVAELSFIYNTWSAVAEDFAPFDIDVTTEAPSADRLIRSSPVDAVFGQAIAVTTENFYCPGTCSGVAGVGVFDEYDAVTPGGWTYFQSFFSPAITAAIISHEMGHVFGLSHDGTAALAYYDGHGSWSPIMGSAQWFRTSQWSKGEYSGANNLEDDIAIIGGSTGFVGDAIGDTIGTATLVDNGNVVVDSLVDNDADVDVYRIVHPGGRLRLDVSLNTMSANLDPRLGVFSAAGAIIATHDPPGAVNASFDAPLVAGTFYAAVSGEAYLTPSTGWSGYASIGQYRLGVSRVFAPGVATALSLSQAGDNRLTLSWAAPTINGGGTTSYEAKVCLTTDQAQCTASTSSGLLSSTFGGLQRGQSYRGWVNVRNELLSSGFVSSAPLVVAEVPDAPSVTATVDLGVQPAVLTVSWCCVDAHGNAITGYQVERVDLATGLSALIGIATSPFSSNDLAAGRRYGFRVRAVAGSVVGAWSGWLYITAPGRTEAPLAPTATPTSRLAAPEANSVAVPGRRPAPQS